MTSPVSVNPNQTSNQQAYGGSDVSGGSAFNIGGINLGTQYPSAATAGGGAAPLVPGESKTLWIAIGVGAAALFAVALLWRRK
jgi:hypothetical protein